MKETSIKTLDQLRDGWNIELANKFEVVFEFKLWWELTGNLHIGLNHILLINTTKLT